MIAKTRIENISPATSEIKAKNNLMKFHATISTIGIATMAASTIRIVVTMIGYLCVWVYVSIWSCPSSPVVLES